ncbi:hypothetical protein BC629DRAFT_1532884 [Irpex lacteus]|nr:hypothetical protein BC629DRAFT_1532884 [Irpex lacteus]
MRFGVRTLSTYLRLLCLRERAESRPGGPWTFCLTLAWPGASMDIQLSRPTESMSYLRREAMFKDVKLTYKSKKSGIQISRTSLVEPYF